MKYRDRINNILIRVVTALLFTCMMIFPAGQASAASILREGSRGTEVTQLQKKLKEQGYFNAANPTGYFGSVTKNAVLRLQRDRNLLQDGIVGSQTNIALHEGYMQLQFGMRGASIANLQRGLKNKGMFYANVTGYYGKATENAVIAFEKHIGLPIDGIADPIMQSKLYNYNSTKSKTTMTNRGSTNTTMSTASSEKAMGDIYWLARIIHAEARGEPYRGKVAVGNVIMNRVSSPSFPNSVYNVIFEYTGKIPQFSPVADGSIYNTPDSESMRAAQESYYGSKPVGAALYFFNPSKAAGTWIVKSRHYLTTIGNHAFYK
jgi:N-acetylmuramoyl-L-alanine amidase